ncbi:MAG: CRISPR-associated endoribonuclease Cas6 [Nitrospirae bacterium]|nr:CRISPR-associated endoribonuclease Cas6 [Nitrospirota bacterium]
MRVKITLSADDNGRIDFNYQHQIQAVIYKFLANSDPDYAGWLHEEGYRYKREQRFKFFVYSGLTFYGPISTKLNNSDSLPGFHFRASPAIPFTFSFQIASPVNRFLQHLIDGIFKEGQEITIGSQRVIVYRVETLADPLEGIDINYSNSPNGFIRLNLIPLESPIFVKKPDPQGIRDVYLFPGDKDYEKLLNQNLIHKYETLYGKPYEGDQPGFEHHPAKGKLIKSFKVYKDGKIAGEIKGTLQPFSVSGSKELIRIGLECGFGQNNSMGCGYVERME